ncbi:MAG: tRNA pseudouridine(38-40) synthase TruA [Chloroflexi bacterium]|nr:tRNA pseudouridine(38-40) synthase TruA [Chloroflexota bacterium]
MTQSRTVRATIEYDGVGFAGFQRQAAARTVQQELEAALATVVGHQIHVTGAGRTDAGTHATGQVVSARVATRLDDATLWRAWNARLPEDLVALSLSTVADSFHARRDAVERTYEYRIAQTPQRPVLDRGRAWHVREPLDVALMEEAAGEFVGAHDFRAFTIGPETRTRRDITNIAVWREGPMIAVRLSGNAFLHRMVRRMVAALVRVGRGDLTAADVRRLLHSGDRASVGATAPAHGLTLVGVQYPAATNRAHRSAVALEVSA